MKELMDEIYPQAEKIVMVMDNLNTIFGRLDFGGRQRFDYGIIGEN